MAIHRQIWSWRRCWKFYWQQGEHDQVFSATAVPRYLKRSTFKGEGFNLTHSSRLWIILIQVCAAGNPHILTEREAEGEARLWKLGAYPERHHPLKASQPSGQVFLTRNQVFKHMSLLVVGTFPIQTTMDTLKVIPSLEEAAPVIWRSQVWWLSFGFLGSLCCLPQVTVYPTHV